MVPAGDLGRGAGDARRLVGVRAAAVARRLGVALVWAWLVFSQALAFVWLFDHRMAILDRLWFW
jgi:hypothetical protein